MKELRLAGGYGMRAVRAQKRGYGSQLPTDIGYPKRNPYG